MKATRLYFILSLLLVVLFSSCLGRNKEYNINENLHDPSFYSLIFYPSKGNEALREARFRLEYDFDLGDSIVVNSDSLPFQTRIDSVTASITFMSSSKLLLSVDNNEKVVTHNDKVANIDFTKPVKLINTSGDKKKSRTYQVKVNVHTVDPNLYQWDEFSKGISTSVGENQKAMLFKDKFLFFSADNLPAVSLFESVDARAWSSKTISFTPSLTKKPILKTLTEHKENLYLVDEDAKLYKSSDAENWTALSVPDLKITNLLFSFKDKIWGVASSDSKYYLASSSDGSVWSKEKAALPFDFPVVDYTALVFKTTAGNPTAIVLGGRDAKNKVLKTRWATSLPHKNWVNLLIEENDTLARADNAAIVQYDNRLVLFGGKNIKGESIGILESYTGGLSWKTPNKEQMSLPEGLEGRLKSSAFVSKDNRHIYFIGGVKSEDAVSDVWRVHLNKITFKDYKPEFIY